VKQKSDKIIVDGKGVVVFVDPKTRKSTSLPDHFIEKVKIFEPSVKVIR
jgi:acyl-CoA thioesterase FadM